MNKSWLGPLSFAFLAAVLLLTWTFLFSPMYTLHTLKTAIDERDKEALQDVIDFPLLRQNLKDSVGAFMTRKMAREVDDNPFAALGMMMANALIDPMINAMVTPAGLAGLAKKKMPDLDSRPASEPQEEPAADGGTRESRSLSDMNFRIDYESTSRFAVIPQDVEDPPEFVFRRDGLFWKMVDVRLSLPE